MDKSGLLLKLKKIWPWYLLLPLVLGFFLATASLNYHVHRYSADPEKPDYVKWGSPDENANYVFAKLYAQTGKIKLFEPYNLYVDDIMRPRSLRSDNGEIKPESFLGIILFFGALAKLTGYKLIPYFTPMLAALGLIIYYLLIRRLFTRANALISVFILASFPAYFYYTARSMFHNVLFTVSLVAALYFGLLCLGPVLRPKARTAGFIRRLKDRLRKNKFISLRGDYRRMFFGLASGLFFGLAIIARTSELIWLLPLLLFLLAVNFGRLGLKQAVLLSGGIFLVLLPMFYYNQILYSSPILGGYADMNRSIIDIKDSGAGLAKDLVRWRSGSYREHFRSIFGSVFVFGFHPRQSLEMADIYIRQMFPQLFYPALAGLLVYLFGNGKRRKRHYLFLAGLALISVILIIYYGSWRFFDNPDKSAHTIGNSYTRYWLPIYLGLIPFASYFIIRLTKAAAEIKESLNTKTIRLGLRVLAGGMIMIISLSFVYQGSEEGLVYLRVKQMADRHEWDRIMALTESNAVIITLYHDKLLFPERKVIVGLFDDVNMVERYARVVRRLPVYYYNFRLPPADIEYLNSRRLFEAGLRIEAVARVTPVFTLYRLLPAAEGGELSLEP